MRGVLHPALAPLIESCHAYDYVGAPETVHHGMPSRTLTLVLAFDRQLEVGPLAATRRGTFWTTGAGLSTAPVGIGFGGRHVGVQVDIHPTASRALFARVMRFEHSRRLISSGLGLAAVADAGGYADQAHLTRDWQLLAGLTPGQWRRQELPFLQDIDEPY